MKELSLNILDIVQNSIRAKAGRIGISIEESVKENFMRILIGDNGLGISPEMLPNVTDPYSTSRKKRNVGLGLAFLQQHSEMAGGTLKIESQEFIGTLVEASFQLDHIDRQPLGDIAGVLKILMIANPDIEIEYSHKTDSGEFKINTEEIKNVFELNDLIDNNLMEDIRILIQGNLEEIGASVSDSLKPELT